MNGRHRSPRLWLSCLLFVSLVRPVAAAEQPPPLLQLQGSEFRCTRIASIGLHRFCAEGSLRERTISVFRNRRTLSVRTDATYDSTLLPVPTSPAASTVRDGSLTHRQLRELNAFLQEVHIGVRTGLCNPFGQTPGLDNDLSTARYEVVWYSPSGRRSKVVFGTEFKPSCVPEILDLFDTMVQFGELIR